MGSTRSGRLFGIKRVKDIRSGVAGIFSGIIVAAMIGMFNVRAAPSYAFLRLLTPSYSFPPLASLARQVLFERLGNQLLGD